MSTTEATTVCPCWPLARGWRQSDKFRGEPTKREEFGPEMLLQLQKRQPPLDSEEGFRNLKEGLKNTSGRLRVHLKNAN